MKVLMLDSVDLLSCFGYDGAQFFFEVGLDLSCVCRKLCCTDFCQLRIVQVYFALIFVSWGDLSLFVKYNM